MTRGNVASWTGEHEIQDTELGSSYASGTYQHLEAFIRSPGIVVCQRYPKRRMAGDNPRKLASKMDTGRKGHKARDNPTGYSGVRW